VESARLVTAEVAIEPRAARFPDAILVATGLLVVVAVFLMVVPIAVLFLTGFGLNGLSGTDTYSLSNFSLILKDPLLIPVLHNTLVTGIGTIVAMLAFTIPCAWLYTRTDLPRKDLLIALLTVKIAVPGFLVAMGYIFLFNPSNGIGNQIIERVLGIHSLFNVYTLGWIALLQGAALTPPAFFMLVPTMRAIDTALEEAAWVSGIRKFTTVIRIILPLTAPALLATCIYFFIIAIEMFDYAGMLGLPSRTFVLSTWLYQMVYMTDGPPQYGPAAALGLLSAGAAIALAGGYLWFTRQAQRYAVVTGKRREHRPTALGRPGKIWAWVFILSFVTFALFIPLLLLVWSSLLPFIQVPSVAALKHVTVAGYREAFYALPGLLKNNLIIMLAAPTISVTLAVCVAWVSTRTQLRGRQSLDVIVMASVAVPSIVGALGFLYFGLLSYRWIPLYTTIWIIVLAMATRSLTWANRTIGSAMIQVHKEIEEVCATSGVRSGRAFVSVLLPIIGQSLMFSWFWVAMLSLRELTIPIMLQRQNTQVIATAIWSFNQSGASNVAAALGVILACMIFGVVIIFHKVAGQRTI
jgi:iron(III) transport system permease protein